MFPKVMPALRVQVRSSLDFGVFLSNYSVHGGGTFQLKSEWKNRRHMDDVSLPVFLSFIFFSYSSRSADIVLF